MHKFSSKILCDIAAERAAQDEQWGGATHDDGHMAHDWLVFIGQQLKRARADYAQVGGFPAPVRARLVKIAALAVAGIESIDRRVSALQD